MELLAWVGKLIWFFFPAGVANMAPVIFRNNFLALAKPIDGNVKLMGKPIFGAHKTWRGLIVGTLLGGSFFLGQKYLSTISSTLADVSLYEYKLFPWWFGFLFAFMALFGDMIKSFFKRRINIRPGEVWFPFDQIDFIIGSTIALLFFVSVDIRTWLAVLCIAIILHIAVNRIGYYMKFKDTPW